MKFSNDLEVKAELIKSNATDLDVCRAAWVSQAGEDAKEKESGRQAGLISYLIRNKHMSPLEHGSFTFFIKCPIFVAREFHRHRTQSYNEVSARYTELVPEFYLPPRHRALIQTGKLGSYKFEQGTIEQFETMTASHLKAYKVCWEEYQNMLDAGIAKEVARNVLPVGIFTSFYATVNPRNLMGFLDLRTEATALHEIRKVASDMEFHFMETMPLTYAAWKENNEKAASV